MKKGRGLEKEGSGEGGEWRGSGEQGIEEMHMIDGSGS